MMFFECFSLPILGIHLFPGLRVRFSFYHLFLWVTRDETKNFTEAITIEKRKVERKKSIDVNVNYDEIFVNGKQVETTMADTLKDIKDKILDIISFDKNKENKDLGDAGAEKIPLVGDGTEMEAIIPLYAEEVVISKRSATVKVAEVVIRKRKVTQTTKIDTGDVVEELTIQNPTGRTPS